MSTIKRTAAVSGAGAGLGRDVALGLAAKGYAVFGTAISYSEVRELHDASGGRVTLTLCDITDATAVKRWAADVTSTVGASGLNLLISNAGILTPGPLEVLTLEAVRHEFDVNLFGALSVMISFLPALRAARGRIVQVSTWTATVPLPFNGPSGASKAAMEVLSIALRAELRKFGIDVVIAVAGNMKTGGPAKTAAALAAAAGSMTPEQLTFYGEDFGAFTCKLNAMQDSGTAADVAARRVIELAEQQPAPSISGVGGDAEEILRAAREMTSAEQDSFRLKLAGLA
ncbi:SDR family NAD(P)-dependent oxidoreductase [Sphingomonas sp. UYP23]